MVLALLGPLEVEFFINPSLIRFVVKPPYLFRASTFKVKLYHILKSIIWLQLNSFRNFEPQTRKTAAQPLASLP